MSPEQLCDLIDELRWWGPARLEGELRELAPVPSDEPRE